MEQRKLSIICVSLYSKISIQCSHMYYLSTTIIQYFLSQKIKHQHCIFILDEMFLKVLISHISSTEL